MPILNQKTESIEHAINLLISFQVGEHNAGGILYLSDHIVCIHYYNKIEIVAIINIRSRDVVQEQLCYWSGI